MREIKALQWYYGCSLEQAYNLRRYIDNDLLWWILKQFSTYVNKIVDKSDHENLEEIRANVI